MKSFFPILGVIGGTGLYDIPGLKKIKTIYPKTPWGYPSDKITIAEYINNNQKLYVAFLPRHGKGHFITPSSIPQKANMAALKKIGVNYIVAFSAVGSLKEEIAPTHCILPNQIIDRTRHREDTFYNEGIVVHASFGDPFCNVLATLLENNIQKLNIPLHIKETLICMEGPTFSTRAESKMYKALGAGIINMSVLPEAKLARELEISYQMVCMSTDYDSWRDESTSVSSEDIMKIVHQNSSTMTKILETSLFDLSKICEKENIYLGTIKNSIITDKSKRKYRIRKRLNWVLPNYF